MPGDPGIESRGDLAGEAPIAEIYSACEKDGEMMGSIDKQATIDAIYEKANEELADANHHFLAGVHMATAVVRDRTKNRLHGCPCRSPIGR